MSASLPASTERLNGFPLGPGVMRRLDADDETLVLEGHRHGRLDFHVLQVVLACRARDAVADDVQHDEDAGPRAVDDAGLEIVEGPPARAARVDHGRGARAEREPVRRHAPRVRPTGISVEMDVDQPGRDVQPRHVHGLRCRGRINRWRDRRNLAILDRHVTDGAHPVPCVDHMAALEEEIVSGCAGLADRQPQQQHSESYHACSLSAIQRTVVESVGAEGERCQLSEKPSHAFSSLTRR